MDKFLAVLANPALLSFMAMIVADLKMRYVASAKPIGVLHSVADLMKGVANFLDQVLGQNNAPGA